jgi:hypothetical protein
MPKPTDLARELDALRERPREFAESEDPPRSKLPALFRAARAAAADAGETERLAELAREFAQRLTDALLLEPITELARDVPVVRDRILETLDTKSPAARFAVERQVALLREVAPAERALERLLDLARDEPSFDGAADERPALLRKLVEQRLACPTDRRDRPSVLVARGALRLLAREAPRETAALAARAVEVETRRAGKNEPELALAAIEVLRGAAPLEKLRAAKTLEKRLDRRVILDRLSELAAEASAALRASPEEVSELLADAAGLDAKGERRIELENGAHALVSIASTGAVAVSVLPEGRALDADERREVDAAVAEIAKLRREHADRLERALVTGRAWFFSLFRELFLGQNALLRDVGSRVVWLATPEKGAPISFRVPRPGDTGPLEDVFSGAFPDLGPETSVRVAHPVELDPDELELWRERFRTLGSGAPLVQPFPQLYRAVGREAGAPALARFVGREAYRDDLIELGKKHGLRGLPLRGDGPWWVQRDFPYRNSLVSIEVEAIAAPAAPPKPRRDAVRVLDEEDPRKPRPPREAAPRVRISKVELLGTPPPVVLSEAAAFLHALTDELTCGTEGFFGDWQRKKFKDPAAAWKLAQERLALGSDALVRARASLLAAAGSTAKVQGRWIAFPGELVLDLGSRHAFEGPLHEWVPPWRLDQRVKAAASAHALELPHERATDEETARVLETALALGKT